MVLICLACALGEEGGVALKPWQQDSVFTQLLMFYASEEKEWLSGSPTRGQVNNQEKIHRITPKIENETEVAHR